MRAAGLSAAGGRGYGAEDLPLLGALGAASSFASIVVLALYISTPAVLEGYARPKLLWLIGVLLLYWTGRVALLANRGVVDDDPVVFALRDRTSWLVALGIVAVFAAALAMIVRSCVFSCAATRSGRPPVISRSPCFCSA